MRELRNQKQKFRGQKVRRETRKSSHDIAHLLRELKNRSRNKSAMTCPSARAAFTLAEVLITLGIIGVVAAITLPALFTNIQNEVKNRRVANIKQKFSKATDKMLSVSGLTGYDSTESFVNELQHHLKLAKICDNSHLNECWPTEKVILNDEGKEWEISKTTTAKQLKMKNDDTHEWSDTVGIITADGTAMILSYNKKCNIDVSDRVIWTDEGSSTAGCVAAVFDWNGAKKPNKLSNDVIAFNANGLGSGCAFELGGKCFGAPHKVEKPLTKVECEERKGELGLIYCNEDDDYYAAAAMNCGGKSKLPTQADTAQIASYIYGMPVSNSGFTKNLNLYDTSVQARISELGFPSNSEFYLWAAAEDGSRNAAYYRDFKSNLSYWATFSRDFPALLVVCLVD